MCLIFFFQAEDGIRDGHVTGVQTCALPISAIRGIGPWTAQMVLLFGYRRPNVLAPGDAGLRRAAQMLYGENTQLMDMHPVWSPWCSVASWYLWHTLHQRDRQPPADDPGPAP